MTTYNLIQKGALQERLSRGLGIQERSPAPTLDAVVQPVVILEDLTKQTPFNQPNERRVWGANEFTAAAGEFQYVALHNPTANAVAVLDFISMAGGSAQTYRGGFVPEATQAALLASLIQHSVVYADPRNAAGFAGAAMHFYFGGDLSSAFVPTSQSAFYHRFALGVQESPRVYPPLNPFVLPPGRVFAVTTDLPAALMFTTFSWIEYVS